ncbi:hypothetical protein K1Y72_07880 [Actinomadura sp. PM05-2]|uniref:Intein C-terminal splicing domain-containing protein n=1 Tax=Actinomadura parmotrematis TaxID=2864039 RepID=A0ABS7FPF9_9ACTN|nr:hypothetical protein [Actinomadura parmotrematis]
MNIKIGGKHGAKTAVVYAAEHHLFWDAGHHAWVRADQLKCGIKLRTPSGSTQKVASTALLSSHPRVHDLTIADTHTFYALAGFTPVLVHNCGGFIGSRDHVALGRRGSELNDFATSVKARHLLGARSDSWRGEVEAAISRVSVGEGDISFMLDGLPEAHGGSAKALLSRKSQSPKICSTRSGSC